MRRRDQEKHGEYYSLADYPTNIYYAILSPAPLSSATVLSDM